MKLLEYLLQQQLAPDEKKAKGWILAGQVLVNEQIINKLHYPLKKEDTVRIKPQKDWASRGAYKLLAALEAFAMDPSQKKIYDIGASHGGFSDVLIQRGADRVFAIDVSYGIFATQLRQHPHVILRERTNILKMTTADFPFVADFLVMDLSFISALTVIRHLQTLFSNMEAIVLIKPQFESSGLHMKKGIVREDYLPELLRQIEEQLQQMTVEIKNKLISPIKGAKGNSEFLYHLVW